MAAPLPLCIVGAGTIGMRHIGMAQRSNRVRLTAVVESDAARRGGLADSGLPVAATLADVPADTRAAVIATPTPAHRMSGEAALQRGLAVLIEKPVAVTLEDARALLATAQARGLPLIVGHHRRCHPFVMAARQAVQEMGELVGLQGMWCLRKHAAYYEPEWRRRVGAGPLMTNLSHEIDLLHFLIGGIAEVTTLTSSARRGLAIEDTAAMAFRFENGMLGSFLVSDAGASPWSFETATGENPAIAVSGEDYIRIAGTEGALAFPSLTRWGRSAPGEIEWSKPLRRRSGPGLQKVDPLLEQLNRFAVLVTGKDDDVLCSGADGIAALDVTLAAALSAKTGHPVRAGAVPADYRGA
ncbi:putative dehydrogenase [Rhodovulum imhoffii]|uniref:Putative dehydrogenase n=1 Tax=Rhodovulum imhoffii TaxID=365340 RepID=A0A2T5BQD2_9RHOB|nr:Gfo/Idh/MocA family oxidoreductase [Rhodovulum imhoffii]MBK5933689.1 oxidoreductase [Rhodovulum imhoffii]PTN01331.1 putative dehydrogenase [Rhodovulum imhoffii]